MHTSEAELATSIYYYCWYYRLLLDDRRLSLWLAEPCLTLGEVVAVVPLFGCRY